VGSDLLVFVLPQKMTVIGPDSIAVLHGARQPDLARHFVEFTLTPEGQRILYQGVGIDGQRAALHRLPVRPDLYREPAAPRANPYGYTVGFTYDADLDNQRRKIVDDMIGVCLIEAHGDLVRAWRAVIARGCAPADMAELGKPPSDGAEVRRLASVWKDPRARLAAMGAWADECKARYARLAGGTAANQIRK